MTTTPTNATMMTTTGVIRLELSGASTGSPERSIIIRWKSSSGIGPLRPDVPATSGMNSSAPRVNQAARCSSRTT